jgi:membrane-associated phospholipid phosphatase
MAAVTMTGSTAVLRPFAAVGCLVLLWRRRLRAACFVALTLPATLGIRLLLVNAIHRPRPMDRLAPAAGWSFPSGHTSASAAAALIAVRLADTVWRATAWLARARDLVCAISARHRCPVLTMGRDPPWIAVHSSSGYGRAKAVAL